MNRAMIRRWVNEYLDGEIGLADKAELERLMAQHPEIREEYKELRRIGLLLGAMPQVRVHPTRFRERVGDALDVLERAYFTPQRAFATAMTVVLLVVGLTFSMVMYQLKLLGTGNNPAPTTATAPAPVALNEFRVTLPVGTSAEGFFDRLLLETQLGMLEPGLLDAVLEQNPQIYEGATCLDSSGLRQTRFASELPHHVALIVTPQQVLQLAQFARGLTGQNVRPEVRKLDGSPLAYQDYLEQHPAGSSLKITLVFQ